MTKEKLKEKELEEEFKEKEKEREHINKRTYKIILVKNYLTTLIFNGNVLMAKDKYEKFVNLFGDEDTMREYVEKIIGTKYKIRSMNCKNDESAGVVECIVFEADGTRKSSVIKEKTFFLINVKTVEKNGRIRKREDVLTAYAAMLEDIKKSIHTSKFEVVYDQKIYEENLSSTKDSKMVEYVLTADIFWQLAKIARNYDDNYTIFVMNEDSESEEENDNFDVYFTIKSLQKSGILL